MQQVAQQGMCGTGAGCLAINYQSIVELRMYRNFLARLGVDHLPGRKNHHVCRDGKIKHGKASMTTQQARCGSVQGALGAIRRGIQSNAAVERHRHEIKIQVRNPDLESVTLCIGTPLCSYGRATVVGLGPIDLRSYQDANF